MKVTKVELYVVDFDQLGEERIKGVIEETKYPNWCIYPRVVEMTTVDIGKWSDDHPINNTDTALNTYKKLFGGGLL